MPRARVILLATAVVLVGACSDDGRELRPPRPDQTASITTAPTTTVSTTTVPTTLAG